MYEFVHKTFRHDLQFSASKSWFGRNIGIEQYKIWRTWALSFLLVVVKSLKELQKIKINCPVRCLSAHKILHRQWREQKQCRPNLYYTFSHLKYLPYNSPNHA